MLLAVRYQSEWLWPPGPRETELMKACCYNTSLVISAPQRAVWLWTNHSKGYTNSSIATKGSIFLEFLTGCGNSFVFLSSTCLVEYFSYIVLGHGDRLRRVQFVFQFLLLPSHSLNFISMYRDLVARDTGRDKVITAIIITPCTYLGICSCESSSMYIAEDAKEKKQHIAEGRKQGQGWCTKEQSQRVRDSLQCLSSLGQKQPGKEGEVNL